MQEVIRVLESHLYQESFSQYHPDHCSCGVKFTWRHRPIQWASHVAAALKEASDGRA